MPINLYFLYNLCSSKERLLEQLQEWKMIPVEGEFKCPRCNNNLTLRSDEARLDGWRWYCNAKEKVRKQKAVACGCTVEFRSGTFFAKSKLEIRQLLAFVNLWVDNVSLTVIKKQTDVANWFHVVNWASYCREVVFHSIMNEKQKLGGVGVVVEIDESKFGKRKYNKGHRVEGQWVFGGYERGTGRIFMVTVEKRDKNTLVPLILEWIEKGSIIISDCWKSYDCLDNEKNKATRGTFDYDELLDEAGYKHLTVNHKITFKDKSSGACTNAIESSWGHAKASFSARGRKKIHIPGNLARYMFQKRCNELGRDRTEEFLRMAGKMYNPCNINPVEEDEIDEEEIDINFDEEFE